MTGRRTGALFPVIVAACAVLAGGVACGGDDGEGGDSSPPAFALRPVIGESDPPCDEGSRDDGVDVLAERRDGTVAACLELGPAIVDTDDVRSAGLGRNLGGPSVSVVLGQAGAATLDDYAARSVGKRLAIVVDGEVTRAPTIQSASFVGRIEVVGLSEERAEKLLRDLDRATGGAP